MEISPYMLTLLLIYSFLFGMSAGALNDINRIIRALMGIRYSAKSFERLYSIKLPFVGVLERGSEKKRVKRWIEAVLIFLQDILLFAYLGCGTVILNYYLNRGQFRLYTIAAVAAGFAIYYFTLGKLVIFLSEGIIFFVRAAVRIILYLVSRPFVYLGRVVVKILRTLRKKIASGIAKKRIMRYNKTKRRELLELSRKGFQNEGEKNGA
ncbi:MAG: spore cortex biosynthesis protein YabQ [Clostridia bacterium]|nr:spore cortex biosynthesis protein YabQ [Clostridia bacterium]